MAEKTYKLLYRQFNESEMLRKAIQRTYIVEQYSEFSSGEILKFRSALGKMRKMLVVGFGEEEEPVFQELLQELSTCDLFQRHPDLLRFAGVHSLVINVMKSYFSFSETLSSGFPSSFGTESSSGFVGMTQTLKLAVSDEGFADIVEDCCKFLCSFAQTSHQNQIALSEHLQYLLDECLIFSDQVASNSTNPLDVAIATISNNLQLVMTLSNEGILHKVVQLMHKMMKYEDEASSTANNTISSPIHKMSVLYDAMPMEWLPTGAEKCLKFLQAAVYVN
ncbi:PREDICTED: ryanodine receptor 3-like, partial [Amphimedon queenslandica]|uniref:RIH domain-containing protein n=2 Tax=Amphimedon queenslandica TaxID=400682 RepID=A0AAN0IU56_AMPQE